MPRKKRHGHGFSYVRDLPLKIRYENLEREERLTVEEMNRRMLFSLIRESYNIYSDEYEILNQLSEVNKQIIPHEEAVIERIIDHFFSKFVYFVEGFMKGLTIGMREVFEDIIVNAITNYYIESYLKKRYEVAYVWKGFYVQAQFDKTYHVIAEDKEEVAEAIRNVVRFANRYVRLVEGYQGETKSMAHEYLSYLRKKRCHMGMVSIKVSPVTIKFLRGQRGNMYAAVHMNARHIAYSPYSLKTIKNIPHFVQLNRKKGYEWFSTRVYSGYDVLELDSTIATAIDNFDNPYLIRRVAEAILRPYVMLKDRARGMGRPELRFDFKHCSLYFIPGRPTKGKKASKLSTKDRILHKQNIYFQRRLI